MRPGLRLSLLLMVSLLLGLAFVPIFWTASLFARVTIERQQRSATATLGRTLAQAIADGQLQPVALSGVVGLKFYPRHSPVVQVGRPSPSSLSERLPKEGYLEEEGNPRIIWSVARGNAGVAHVGTRLSDRHTERQSYLGLLALYMALLGLGLLLAIHLALTFLIVRPLDALARAAERVSVNKRPFILPALPVRELDSLGKSFHLMTERLLAEEVALTERVAQVNEANLRLKQAQEHLLRSERLASVGRLAAGLAHELGNPIAAIIGLEELLLQGGLTNTEERDFLQRISRETERINRILRELLDFARPTMKNNLGESDPPGDVIVAIREVLSLVQPQKLFRGIAISTEHAERLPLVRLPHPKVVQVLLNLLLNAADALRNQGSIVISLQRTQDELVEISITDNGPGVAVSVREHLFEPFTTTKEVGKGTGLGLAVCRGLVEGAGGSMSFDEKHTPGARFVALLPVFPQPES